MITIYTFRYTLKVFFLLIVVFFTYFYTCGTTGHKKTAATTVTAAQVARLREDAARDSETID
jgi:hypothetical protein